VVSIGSFRKRLPVTAKTAEVDVAIRRLLDFLEERDRAHHLPRLTVAALRNFVRNPGFCSGLATGDPLDSSDLEQERSGFPSRNTVQAPHCASPQPNVVPIMPTHRGGPTREGCRHPHQRYDLSH
jgi:hypothetical protein